MSEAKTPKKSSKPLNVGAQLVAAIYAKSLLGAAVGGPSSAGGNGGGPSGAAVADGLVEEFDAFVSQVLDARPDFEQLLGSAMVSADEKTRMIDKLLSGRASTLFLNFLKVVARRGRLGLLRVIHEQVLALHDEARGRVRVGVTTAAPIDAALSANIQSTLKNLLAGEPVLETAEDPALIGGVVLRVGDTVYDGSVARQLAQLREQMIDRSVHEIQRRRDRFRNSG